MTMPERVILREKDGSERTVAIDLVGIRVGDSTAVDGKSYVRTAEVKDGAPVFQAED